MGDVAFIRGHNEPASEQGEQPGLGELLNRLKEALRHQAELIAGWS